LILIVDNEQRNRDLLQIMLAAEGFQIQCAASGEEGLAMISLHLPDLVLLDVMMAGMDGYQMAAKIKGNRATKHIPIIMVPARDDQDGKMLGLLSGAENFLTKPVNRAELCLRARNGLKAHCDFYREQSERLERQLVTCSAELAERTRGPWGNRAPRQPHRRRPHAVTARKRLWTKLKATPIPSQYPTRRNRAMQSATISGTCSGRRPRRPRRPRRIGARATPGSSAIQPCGATANPVT